MLDNMSYLIGSARSGTTWLSQQLNSHPEVFCSEGRLFGDYADAVQDHGAEQPRIRLTLDKFVENVLQHYFLPKDESRETLKEQLITEYIEATLRVLNNKNKPNFVENITPYRNTCESVVNRVNTFTPKAKLIFLVRDGRDVVTSLAMNWLNKEAVGEGKTDYETRRNQAYLNSDSSFVTPQFFEDVELKAWSDYWVEASLIFQSLKESHDHMIVHYEDMRRDPIKEFSTICKFLNIDSSSEVVGRIVDQHSFSKQSGRQAGQENATSHHRKGIVGDWQRFFTQADGQKFESMTSGLLKTWGYTNGDDWYLELAKEFRLQEQLNA